MVFSTGALEFAARVEKMSFSELRAEQQRQLIDSVDLFGAWRTADGERRRRFAGSMRWVERSGRHYLLRKIRSNETSLGPRTSATEETYERFVQGRDQNSDLLAGLATRLDQMAPINKALGLGRLPTIAARILRDLDSRDLLGHQLFVVGTNAIFGYEARAGVHVASELLATADVDLLLDARQRLSIVAQEVRQLGLLGILQRLDRSFAPISRGGFRAVNRDGYFVDLIRPEARDMMRDKTADALSKLPDELHGSPIRSLRWLVNAPRFQAVAIAEDGYPAPIVCIDPRVFALHKVWISRDPTRDPRKKKRDLEQAKTCAAIASARLGMSFDDTQMLSALPASLRSFKDQIVVAPPSGFSEAGASLSPNW
jgi:hypothetical protein